MVASDEEGQVLAAAANYPVLVSSPVLAEATMLRWVCFETDNLQLFQRWLKPPDGASYLVSIIRDCFSLRSFSDVMSLSFVRRSGNSITDFLARKASSFPDLVSNEEVPSEANDLVSADIFPSMSVQV